MTLEVYIVSLGFCDAAGRWLRFRIRGGSAAVNTATTTRIICYCGGNNALLTTLTLIITLNYPHKTLNLTISDPNDSNMMQKRQRVGLFTCKTALFSLEVVWAHDQRRPVRALGDA